MVLDNHMLLGVLDFASVFVATTADRSKEALFRLLTIAYVLIVLTIRVSQPIEILFLTFNLGCNLL